MSEMPFTNKPLLIRQHLYFRFLFLFQRIVNRQLMFEIKSLAKSLETTLLPPLKESREKWAFFSVSTDKNNLQFLRDDKTALSLPDTSKLARALLSSGVKKIQLDSWLEKGQIVDILAVFCYAAPFKIISKNQSSPNYIAGKKDLARVLSGEGLHKFCAHVIFFRDKDLLKIEYSYCELFYTYSLKQFLYKFSKTPNHRALFTLAPQAGVFAASLFFLHNWYWWDGSASELGTGLFVSLALGGIISYLVQTLASVLYDQEHRDIILGENFREITALSHFPLNNPNPILKVDSQGNFLFHNHAAEDLLAKMGEDKKRLDQLLPENYVALVKNCLKTKETLVDIEVFRHQKTIRYNISPFPSEQAVLVAGNDTSRLKELELELRELNQTLEKKVIERTSELQSTQDVTILSLTALAETRDPETGAHIQRTRLYVKILAEHLRNHPRFKEQLDDDLVIDLLYRSAPLHDIGKVGIQDSILMKPGKLTPEEFKEMKKHSKIGGDSLRWAEEQLGTNSFLKYAREIAYHHHEKWNGSGYPYGLVGDAIPLSGRLMALADVYDALTSKRVYKDAFSYNKARKIILKGKGTHFDPDMVESFLEKEQDFIEVASLYKEE